MQRLASLLLLLCLLVACGGPAEDPDIDDIPVLPDASAVPATPGTGEQVAISFAVWEYEQQMYEPLVEQFTAENPNISVVLVLMDDLLNVEQSSGPDSPLNAVRRLVSGADTLSSSFIPPEAFGTNLLLDLTPLMEADPNFSREDFYPGALERVTAKGGTWALPRYLYVQVLSYNQDLFKNANLAEPKAGWNWNDVLAAAEQLTQRNGSTVETYGVLEPTGGMLALPSILKAQGIELLNTPPKEVQLDQPEVIAALERLSELNKNGVLLRPQYREDQEPLDFQQLVRDGRVALWGDEFIGVKGDSGQPQTFDFPVGKVPYPVDDTGIFGITGPGDGFIISGGTAHPNESWKWIEFLSRQQPTQGPSVYGGVPARKSLAEQSGFWQGMDEATTAAYQAAIAQNAQAAERTPDYTVFGALSQALSGVLDNDQEPRKALQEAQQQMQDQIAQTELTPTAEPDTSPVIVATPEPQVAPEGATTINFGLIGYGTSEMRKLARAFRDQHPDIFVQIKSTDVFTRAPELQDLAGTNDCFSWWSAPQSDADFKGLLDLQPLLDADAAFPRDDYGEALLEPYRRNGGLFGLPYAVNYRTLNFNRTLFDTAGIEPPSYEWKPDDFLAAAQALTTGEGDKKQYGYVSLYGSQQDLFFFVGQLGARISSGSGSDIRPNFDDPKLAEAIQWYLDLSKKHKVAPLPSFPYKRDDPGGDDKSFELIQQGRAGMWFDQGYGMFNPNPGGPAGDAISVRPVGPGVGQPLDFEVGLSPLPIGGQGLRSGDFYVRGFHISAQSQHAQACWEWLKFLSADITNLQGSIPARASIGESEDFINQASPESIEIAKIYAEALKRPGQPGDDINALFSKMDPYWFFKAISEAVEDKTDLGEGLAAAQKLTNAYLDCIEQNPGKPATCATQVDPTYQGYNTEDPPEGGPRPLG